jgi:biotin carboxylase
MGLTTVRYFRDKLSMRARAKEAGIRVPEFAPVLNYDDLREYMARVPAPWLLKPRSQASGIGMKKIQSPDELWPWLDELGDQQSFYLLEHFVPGTVYHVDSIASEREVVFAEAHKYGTPPLTTSHQGGVFTTSTLPADAPEYSELLSLNQKVLGELGFVRGVTHAEFLRADSDGKFYFIEVAARVGGAFISDVIEVATGINLWREWARLEVGAGREAYQLPPHRREYAGVILSLARQEHPDTSGYKDPEVVQRISKYHHAGLVLKAADSARLQKLIASYAERFQQDFLATQPVPDKPTF